MKQRTLLFAVFVGALLLACSCSKTDGSNLGKEVLSVRILTDNGFEWHNVGDERPGGGQYTSGGGRCVVPLSISETIAEVQKTLTPEDGWTLHDSDRSVIMLGKTNDRGQESVLIYFTLGPRIVDTLVRVIR